MLRKSSATGEEPIAKFDPKEWDIPETFNRHLLTLVAGPATIRWQVPSLNSLFRGERQPPVLGDYPQEYNDSFAILEVHVLELSNLIGDRCDQEMLEVFSALRRRPDGRSHGYVHDYMWQAAALVLGTRPLSRAEFESIMSRLERSCRTFSIGPVSRNYVAALKVTFGQLE